MNEIHNILNRYLAWTDNVEDVSDVYQIPHFCIPKLNTYFENKKTVSGFSSTTRYVEEYEKLPYSISSSLPFGEPALLRAENLNGLDPGTELINDKNKWETVKNKIILANLKSKTRGICKKKKKNIMFVSPGILKLAEHLELDPDPNFCVRHLYNWYYSEGTLNRIYHDGRYFLLSTRSSTPGDLHVTPLNITEKDCIPGEKKRLCLRTGNNQIVYQTVVNKNIIALRQKNHATLFKTDDERKVKFKKIHDSCELSDSIVSLAIGNKLDGEYCTLNTSHMLKVWSAEKKNDSIFSYKFYGDKYCNNSCDHWGSVKCLSENYFIITTRNCVFLKDRRTDLNADLKWWPQKSNYKCNYISFISISNFNSYNAFVGTKHSLLQLDLRKDFMKEWTHMMECAPLYGTSCSIVEDSEAVFFGGQNINEVCVIESEKNVIPNILPSPSETIRNCKLSGMCLDPSIATRCNFSLTGLTCIPFKRTNGKGVYIFRSTSVGDIFYQKAVKENNVEVLVNGDHISTELLSKWEENCINAIENFSDKPLPVTDIMSKNETCKIFCSKDKRLESSLKPKYGKNKEVTTGGWHISKKKLLELEQPIEQCIIDVWDIEDDEEWDEKIKNINESFNIGEKTDTNSKIESWFSCIPNDKEAQGVHNILNSKSVKVMSFPSTSKTSSTL